MIPRILVPKNAGPIVPRPDDAPPRRLSSELDARTLVPSDLPNFELDPHSNIPSYFKLEVLGSAVVVPRDMPNTPLDATSNMPSYVPLSILDSRVAVPKDAHASKIEPKQLVAIQDLPDVLDPDVLTTGEVNLMTRPVQERTSAWNTLARFASIAFHFAIILLILLAPKIFPDRTPTTAEIARNATDLYMPSDLGRLNRPSAPPAPRAPVMKIDPRLLRQLAPPRPTEQPALQAPPTPEPPKETPAQKTASAAPMSQPHPAQSPIRPQTPPPDVTPSLTLPRFSPGKALEDSMHEAMRGAGEGSATTGSVGRIAPGGGGGGYGGGGGQGFAGNAVTILTPTEGVDFNAYITRVLATVKQNWYAVMPESARLGDQGKVVLQFRIMKNGVVPEAEPVMMGSSGKEPLDRAASSSIRASTPFEPLPSAFSGPYIELRFIFLYNIPLNSQTAQ